MTFKVDKKLHIGIPKDVELIIDTLENKGFEAFAVGGCVRDSLIGREPEDWDITTSALPADIKASFRRTVDTGIEHGTVTVMIGDCSYEVTTYRVDGEYRDLRHPARVSFTSSVEEDLRRRDFTINAMAYNKSTGILDLFGGREDLERGIVRCVGKADERFDEDALRILRAVRFAAQLDLEIDPETSEAVKRHAANLSAVSKERIMTELTKIICSAHIERVRDIFELGLAPYISEGFEEIRLDQLDVLRSIAASGSSYSVINGEYSKPESAGEIYDMSAFDLRSATGFKNRYVRFALLTEGMDVSSIRKMLKGLKPDNETLNNTCKIAELIFKPLSTCRFELKKSMSAMTPELFSALLGIKEVSSASGLYRDSISVPDVGESIKTADAGAAADCGYVSVSVSQEEDLAKVRAVYEDILKSKEPVYLSDLAVTGKDLKSWGIEEGPAIGKILNKLLDLVQKEPDKNNPEYLRRYIEGSGASLV